MDAGRAQLLTPGARLGPFVLARKIAVGGMAEVWAAEESGPGNQQRLVALKLLQPEYAGDAAFRALFRDEVQIAQGLDHPGIVKVYGAFEYEGLLFSSMELLDGLDLRRVSSQCARAKQRLPVPIALYIAQQVAEALAYAHGKRDAQGKALEIVHRDVSPHNVMLTRSGQLKLLDFGVAHAAERLARNNPGAVRGKVAYMAPEQALGVGVTPQTDIFATGVVLWEMLALERLFKANDDSDAMAIVVAAQAPRIESKNRDVGPETSALLHRMLEQRAPNRPASMVEVQGTLARILDKRYPGQFGQAPLARFLEGHFEAQRPKSPVRAPVSHDGAETGPLSPVGEITEPVPAPDFDDTGPSAAPDRSSGGTPIGTPSGATVAMSAVVSQIAPTADVPSQDMPTEDVGQPSDSGRTQAIAAPSLPQPSSSEPSLPDALTPSESARATGIRLPTKSEIRRAIEEQHTQAVKADPEMLRAAAAASQAALPVPQAPSLRREQVTEEGSLLAPAVPESDPPARSESGEFKPLSTGERQVLAGSIPGMGSNEGLPAVPLSISAVPTEPPSAERDVPLTLAWLLPRITAALAAIFLLILLLLLLRG